MSKLRLVAGGLLLIAAGLAWIVERQPAGSFVGPETTVEKSAGSQALASAFARRANDEWVEARLTVVRLLTDDNDGRRHQRFIATSAGGQSILVAHNIDLAERVPVAVGDNVYLRGQYEWNDRGGVIHWTHHDPAGRHGGGFVRHEERVYR